MDLIQVGWGLIWTLCCTWSYHTTFSQNNCRGCHVGTTLTNIHETAAHCSELDQDEGHVPRSLSLIILCCFRASQLLDYGCSMQMTTTLHDQWDQCVLSMHKVHVLKTTHDVLFHCTIILNTISTFIEQLLQATIPSWPPSVTFKVAVNRR